jgi:hypothetical protein
VTPRSEPANIPASVRARLLNVGRERGLEFQLVLSDFAIERFLYRLATSPHASDYVLKGAMLFRTWSSDRHRATWDLDLLGRGPQQVDRLEEVVREICSMPGADGITFDAGSVRGELIRAGDEEAGVRVRFTAHLAEAKIPVQVDVGFGDAVIPEPQRASYPTLLGQPAPTLLAYPREAVVAEKFEAMVSIGVTNSRMKDFYDVHTLASTFHFDGITLATAIGATFAQRGTDLPGPDPLVLTDGFLNSPERQTQWRAFLKRARLPGPAGVTALSGSLRRFLGPVVEALISQRTFAATWLPRGPWEVR